MYAELIQKQCTKCKENKSYSEYQKHSRYKDGHLTWCNSCKLDSQRKNPEANKRWAKENSAQSKRIKNSYIKRNQDKVKQSQAAWRKANSKHQLALTRKYQASKLCATPKWLTKSQEKQMIEIYKNCPKGHHVDHIIPLQGKDVRGLHVPWNLQYLPASENQKKSNSYNKY